MKTQSQLEESLKKKEALLRRLKKEVLTTLYGPTYDEIKKLTLEIKTLKWVLK